MDTVRGLRHVHIGGLCKNVVDFVLEPLKLVSLGLVIFVKNFGLFILLFEFFRPKFSIVFRNHPINLGKLLILRVCKTIPRNLDLLIWRIKRLLFAYNIKVSGN